MTHNPGCHSGDKGVAVHVDNLRLRNLLHQRLLIHTFELRTMNLRSRRLSSRSSSRRKPQLGLVRPSGKPQRDGKGAVRRLGVNHQGRSYLKSRKSTRHHESNAGIASKLNRVGRASPPRSSKRPRLHLLGNSAFNAAVGDIPQTGRIRECKICAYNKGL